MLPTGAFLPVLAYAPPKSSRFFVALKLATKGAPTLDNAPQLPIGMIREDVLQLVERKWLGQMEIETGCRCPRLVGFGCIARQRYQYDVVESAIQANRSRNFEAVHF